MSKKEVLVIMIVLLIVAVPVVSAFSFTGFFEGFFTFLTGGAIRGNVPDPDGDPDVPEEEVNPVEDVPAVESPSGSGSYTSGSGNTCSGTCFAGGCPTCWESDDGDCDDEEEDGSTAIPSGAAVAGGDGGELGSTLYCCREVSCGSLVCNPNNGFCVECYNDNHCPDNHECVYEFGVYYCKEVVQTSCASLGGNCKPAECTSYDDCSILDAACGGWDGTTNCCVGSCTIPDDPHDNGNVVVVGIPHEEDLEYGEDGLPLYSPDIPELAHQEGLITLQEDIINRFKLLDKAYELQSQVNIEEGKSIIRIYDGYGNWKTSIAAGVYDPITAENNAQNPVGKLGLIFGEEIVTLNWISVDKISLLKSMTPVEANEDVFIILLPRE